MTKEEETELWIQILKPLAKLAVVNEYLASHPNWELSKAVKFASRKIEQFERIDK